MTVQTVETKAALAARAKSLLDDDLFQSALENVKRFHVEQIADSLPGQGIEREHSCFMIKAIEEIKAELQNYITDASIQENRNPK